MKRYWGGQKVEPGTYVNLAHLSFQSVQTDESLSGTELEEYRRVPTLALIAIGPILGGLYVIFLPVLGFAMLAWTAGSKALQLAGLGAASTARVLKPAWVPHRASLGAGKAAAKPTEHTDTWAEETAKELREPEADHK